MRSRTVGALALVIGSAVPVLVHAPQADAVTSQQAISVKDAAARSGFSDPNYFAKVFRKVMGMSPSQYQASVRIKHR